jgi:hypothetical protein
MRHISPKTTIPFHYYSLRILPECYGFYPSSAQPKQKVFQHREHREHRDFVAARRAFLFTSSSLVLWFNVFLNRATYFAEIGHGGLWGFMGFRVGLWGATGTTGHGPAWDDLPIHNFQEHERSHAL